MRVDGVVVDDHGLDERIDGKIGALVQQVVEPAKVVFGNEPCLPAGSLSAFATSKQKTDPEREYQEHV